MTKGQKGNDGHEKRLSSAGSFNAASSIDRAPLAKKCVARVWHDEGPGSGVLLPDNWFLTNNHVLPTKEKATAAVAQFDYERQADGKFSPMKQYHFDPDAGFHTSRATDGDDWTVVKLKGDANVEFGAITLEVVAPQLNEVVSIIQHPDANPKQVAQGSIIEVVDSPRRIRYRVDTHPGSSGSPVFNGLWQIVALHHSSSSSRDKETGESVECNQGVHIDALLDGLKGVGVWPHQLNTGDFRLPDGTWRIERKADLDALKYLQSLRISVALKGGKLMGKSLISDRIGREMEAEGWQAVEVDLRNEFAEEDYQTGHGFLRRLAEKIVDQTNSDPMSLVTFERDGTPTAFKTFLEELRIGRPGYRLLIRLDRVDALGGRPCCSSVLSGLRVVHNSLRALGNNAWLQMLFLYTITPRQTDTLGSVFDVAKIIEVTDFSRGELQKLATLYRLPEVDVSKLHSFLGGHPTLSQDTFVAMRDDNSSLEEIISDAENGGIFKQHLDQLTREFRTLSDARQQLANSFRALVHGDRLDSEETFDMLLALGVVKGTYSGDAAVRCELYKTWLPPRISG